MYDSPKSDLIVSGEIKHIRVVKTLLYVFILVGIIESFGLLDLSGFEEFDLWFSVFYAGISVAIVLLVFHDINIKPKTAYKFPAFFGLFLLFIAGFNLVDDDASIIYDVVLVFIESAIMITVSFMLKTNFKSAE